MWNYCIRKNPYDDLMWQTPVTPIMDVKKDEKGNYYGKVREYQGANYLHINTTGRLVTDPKPYIPGFETEVFRAFVPYYDPFTLKGVNILNIGYVLADKLPESYIYIPALRRVRKLSSSERFESPVGDTAYLSEHDFHADPVLTWSYKIIDRRPMLCTRGPSGIREPKVEGSHIERITPWSEFQLRPEVYVLEAYPTGFPRAPYSKKILYMEPINNFKPYTGDIYDKAGNFWKTIVCDFYCFPTGNGEYEPDYGSFYTIDFMLNAFTWRYWSDLPVHNAGFKVTDYFTPKAIIQLFTPKI
jgi:hypothetical protein